MKTLTKPVLNRLPMMFAVGALALFGARAQAADLPEVTIISTPSVKTVDRDAATGAPIQQVTKSARITVDRVTLTTNSGVALLKDKVLETAQRLCSTMGPLLADTDDGSCVREAVKSAQTQIEADVAEANRDSAQTQSPAHAG